MKYLITTFSLFLLAFHVFAQIIPTKYTLSGYVRDVRSGEEIIGAVISIRELPNTSTVSNAYGFYSLTIPAGEYQLLVQYIGYATQSVPFVLNRNLELTLLIQDKVNELQEVVVSSRQQSQNVVRTGMGVERLNMKEMSKIPVIMGERDILKVIQLLPGVKSSTEGGAGFYVRGGGADQNLIILDEAPVYNATHLMGFFSVFNSDVIKDVTLYKGILPAEYGGRLSSVLDVRMKEGSNKNISIEGGIGLIASRLSIEGPLVKDKSSFVVAARRTYADAFLKLAGDQASKNQLYFYDFNAKANYIIDTKNRLFLSGYFGRDNLNLSNQYFLKWGNTTGTLRWNHIFNNKLFSNTSLIYSNYNYQVANNPGGNIQYTTSTINDYNLKQDFQYYTFGIGTIKFGLNSIYHIVSPIKLSNEAGNTIGDDRLKRYGWENAAYISHEHPLFSKLTISYGVRLNAFSIIGPGDYFNFNNLGEITDTARYTKRSFLKTYFNVEPRLMLNYRINETNSIKVAYSRTAQNLHMLSASSTSDPTDLWIPNSFLVKPERCDQYSIGYFRNFGDGMFEFSTETYYKDLQDQIDLKDGAILKANTSVESEILFGRGRAYGIEFLLKRKKGDFTGWIGYTLSRTEKQIDGINNNNYYPARQDRTHDVSIVGIYQLSKKWSVSANWVYYTGNAVTFPNGKYDINGQILNYYSERNGNRMPDYHRLDIGATWQRKNNKKFESSWTFSLYNAYGRQNPFIISFQQSTEDPSKTEVIQTSLFRWIPSFTYNLKFK